MFDKSSELSNNGESVTFSAPVAGDYFILLYGFQAYSGVTLTATYAASAVSPVASLTSFTTSTTSVTVGQAVDLTIVGRNSGSGPGNTQGYMSIAFRQLTASGNSSQVSLGTATNGGSYAEYATGTTISPVSGSPFPAQYLLTEYRRDNWPVSEQNTFTVHWVPTTAGTYTIEGKVALQVGGGTTFSRAPTSGSTDQQGSTVQTLTVTVTNPVQPPVASLTSFSTSTASVTVGQAVDLTIVGRNSGTGPGNTQGYMSVAFRQLTASGDASQTTLGTATNGGSYAEYAAGATINPVSGSPFSAQYLLAEYRRDNWPASEQNTFTVHWVPTTAGTYTIEGKVALQIGGEKWLRFSEQVLGLR